MGLNAGLESGEYLGVFGVTTPLQASLDVETAYDEGRGLRVQAGGGTSALGIDFVQPINRSFGAAGAAVTLKQVSLRLETQPEAGALAFKCNLRSASRPSSGRSTPPSPTSAPGPGTAGADRLACSDRKGSAFGSMPA